MYKRYINFIIIVGKPIIYKREDFYPTHLLIIKPKLISFCNLTFKIILQISLLSSEDNKCENTSQTFFKKWNSFISLVRYSWTRVLSLSVTRPLCAHAQNCFFLIPAQNMLDWFGSAILNDLLKMTCQTFFKKWNSFISLVRYSCTRVLSLSVTRPLCAHAQNCFF